MAFADNFNFYCRGLKGVLIMKLIDTAMSSCVQPANAEEQNELVVRTGLELRLRRLDEKTLKGRGVFVIGTDRNKWNVEQFQKECGGLSYLGFADSILEIPKDYRSKEIIICYNEPSYNGRQCLYHLFGERLAMKPYHAFVDAMEQTQKNGDAIVFTAEEVMWFPGQQTNNAIQEKYRKERIFLELKKEADLFNEKHKADKMSGHLIIHCEAKGKYYYDWVNMAEKLFKRLEENAFYPSLTVTNDWDRGNTLTYTIRVKGKPTIYRFDTEQEWSSGIVFSWIQEQWKNSDAANRIEPKMVPKPPPTPEEKKKDWEECLLKMQGSLMCWWIKCRGEEIIPRPTTITITYTDETDVHFFHENTFLPVYLSQHKEFETTIVKRTKLRVNTGVHLNFDKGETVSYNFKPGEYSAKNCVEWMLDVIKKKQSESESKAFQESINAIKPSIVVQEQPEKETKAQLAVITESLKALTEAVAALAAKA